MINEINKTNDLDEEKQNYTKGVMRVIKAKKLS